MDPNYFPDRNPFSLAKPPSWWLRGLAVFDPDLVLVPARNKPVHLLARRRRLSRPLGAALERKIRMDDPSRSSASALCDAYNLVLVTTIVCTGAWTEANLQVTIEQLDRRDTWKHGGGPLTEDQQRAAAFEGGSKLAKQIDKDEIADKRRLNKHVRDDLYHATGDAWRSRQARLGERSKLTARPEARIQRAGLIATPRPMPTRPLIGV